MAAYVHGSVATQEQIRREAKVVERRKVVYRKKAIPTQEKLLYLFAILMCVVVAGTIIWRYAQIYQMNVHLQQIDSQIQDLESQNEQLKLEVTKLQDPKEQLKKAGELGLLPADEQHISEIPSVSGLSASDDHVALK